MQTYRCRDCGCADFAVSVPCYVDLRFDDDREGLMTDVRPFDDGYDSGSACICSNCSAESTLGENRYDTDHPREWVDLPAHWASALINGDHTGLSDQEADELLAWLGDNPNLGECLTCTETPEPKKFNGLLTEVLTYVFPIRQGAQA